MEGFWGASKLLISPENSCRPAAGYRFVWGQTTARSVCQSETRRSGDIIRRGIGLVAEGVHKPILTAQAAVGAKLPGRVRIYIEALDAGRIPHVSRQIRRS